MNKYLKEFLLRGLMFSGFGPIIFGIVIFIIEKTAASFSITAGEVLFGIISTYIIAFAHAGSSVFHKIEHWQLSRALLCQLSLLYTVYTLFYLLNSWIPLSPTVIAVYTAAFVLGYLLICAIVYLSIRSASKRLNGEMRKSNTTK